MVGEKRSFESLVKGGKVCVKCGSEVPKDDIAGRCEIVECPKCSAKEKKD